MKALFPDPNVQIVCTKHSSHTIASEFYDLNLKKKEISVIHNFVNEEENKNINLFGLQFLILFGSDSFHLERMDFFEFIGKSLID